ncbi:MAG: VacJ family lipoprotein [Pseudomonadales bacterium]
MSLRPTFSRFVGVLLLTLAMPNFAASVDPFEDINRKIFGFNEVLDRWLVKPSAKVYQWVMPSALDRGVTNFFDNIGEFSNVVNSGLQGDLRQSGRSLGRLAINTTVGIGGLFDVATDWGIEERNEDFGQTLAVWGVGDGPYIVLPLMGGRYLRDALAIAPDAYISPLDQVDDVQTRNSIWAVKLLDKRADLLDAERLISGDRYTFIREIYIQQREVATANGQVDDDFGDDF